jgi:hypothetical protein
MTESNSSQYKGSIKSSLTFNALVAFNDGDAGRSESFLAAVVKATVASSLLVVSLGAVVLLVLLLLLLFLIW